MTYAISAGPFAIAPVDNDAKEMTNAKFKGGERTRREQPRSFNLVEHFPESTDQ
jgi:hypothetical protein